MSLEGFHSEHDGCCHHTVAPSVHQTLDEMEFERGVWCAAKDGDLDKVQAYLCNHGNPNAVDSAGYTALHYASRNGHYEVCAILLLNRADVNSRTRSGGSTPLHRAAYCGHKTILELLIQHKCNVLLQDADGKTALHKAVEGGHTTCAQILTVHDNKIKDILDNRNKRPVDYCIADKTDLLTVL